MHHTHNSLYDRCLEKTPEQVFVNSLRREFELSPAESLGILELAKNCLFGKTPKTLGKIKILCASRKAIPGKPGFSLPAAPVCTPTICICTAGPNPTIAAPAPCSSPRSSSECDSSTTRTKTVTIPSSACRRKTTGSCMRRMITKL